MRRLVALCTALLLALPAAAQEGVISHGLSLFGDLKYGPDFRHFEYVNPDAPKGGTLRLGINANTFDTFNPYVVKGNPAPGLGDVFESLMAPSLDEPSSEYGLIAEKVEVAKDRMWVVYYLREEARFHDGSPIRPEDVIWSFNTLREKGRPHFRGYYGDVTKVEKVGERGVKFSFKSNENRELPQIIGQMPVLSEKYWSGREFDRTILEPPVGSGPYRIESFDPGRSITYRRVADWWGANLPVNKGQYNFDLIIYDLYRDQTVLLEAFKAGRFDFRMENSAKNWATAYDVPAVREGLIKKEEIKHELPTGMQGFVYNTRREIFQDRRVRQALAYAFDFEWANKNLFYGAYTRTKSYFSNSELASSGLPQGEELKLLEAYRGRVPEEVFTTEYQPPTYDGSGNIRDGLRKALALLKSAGWTVKSGQLVNDKTGRPFEFEILLADAQFERIVLPFTENLKRLGIVARVRTVDSAQYQRRQDTFDFDMVVATFGQSLSPGNEQRDFWSSAAAAEEGSRNLMGVRDPVVDELIEKLIVAPDRESLITRTRALDRVLLHGYYVIPNWHIQSFRVAYWNKFKHPAVTPKYGLSLNGWWLDQPSEKVVEERKQQVVKE